MMMVMMMMMVIKRNKTTWRSSPTRTSHSSPARRALGLGSRPLRRRPDSSFKTRKPSCFNFLKTSHIKQNEREEYLRRCGCLFWFEAISAKISVTSSPVSIVDTSVPGHCSLVLPMMPISFNEDATCSFQGSIPRQRLCTVGHRKTRICLSPIVAPKAIT